MARIMKSVVVVCLSIIAIPILFGACDTVGGGGLSVQADTAFDRTGTLRSDGVFTSMMTNNYAIAGSEVIPGVGDKAERAIVSVVLNQVPAGANVTRVLLRLKGAAAEGDPFGKFGNMSVDHIDVVSSISADAFAGKTLTAGIGTITTLPGNILSAQTVELDVTAQVQADLAAGRPISSFRFLFANAPANDLTVNEVFFHANSGDEALRPQAQIYYTQ